MKKATDSLGNLFALVARLRGPDGCPWDREQSLKDVRAYLLEEAHECAAAIDSGSWEELQGELGDLLFQLVFIVRLAEEAGKFGLEEVAAGVHAKMVSRHPHVFGAEELGDSRAVREAWERRKIEARPAEASLLGGVPNSLPALVAAYRMTQKASAVGFDWPQPQAVLDKIEEETDELRRALELGPTSQGDDAVFEEFGDLLFTVANLARKLEIDPEAALAAANAKFRRRFSDVEKALRDRGRGLNDASLDEMEQLWQDSKLQDDRTES